MPYYIALACSALYADPGRDLPSSMRDVRHELGWSQERLTKALGYSGGAQTVWQFERAERRGGTVKRPVMLALAALHEGLLPWHRLRRRLRLKDSDRRRVDK